MTSVLGHLALAFAPSAENLATEALAFVLDRSLTAREALTSLASALAPITTRSLVFRTQAGESDGTIPDLIGEDALGNQPLILEAKFWAGLTERQPVEYVGRLPSEGGLLLFVAPEKRFETLWPELRQRLVSGRYSLEPHAGLPGIRAVGLGQGRVLALVSWGTLLRHLIAATESAGERDREADLRQLVGLCELQDVQAFRPVTSADLTGDLGERIVQWCRLVDDVVHAAKAEGLLDKRGTRAQGGDGYWGHYATLGSAGIYLHFSSYKWARVRPTPIWLTIFAVEGRDWRPGLIYQDALRPLAALDPPGVLIDRGRLEVPFNVPTGKERDDVVLALLSQLRRVWSLLASAAPELPCTVSRSSTSTPAASAPHPTPPLESHESVTGLLVSGSDAVRRDHG